MKRKIQLIKIVPMMSLCLLLAFVSCQSDSGNSTKSDNQNELIQLDEGLYVASLTPLNTSVSPAALGAFIFSIQGDKADATINVITAPTGVAHPQFIYVGDKCPTAADDTNSDTFLDALEGIAVFGQILIPFDGNLNSQDEGSLLFPSSDDIGAYQYLRSASLAKLLEDLKLPDPDTTDSIAKLAAGEELNLAGRVLVIHGVSADTVLPDTVGTIQGAPNTLTLPIACGIISRVGDATGGTTGETTGGTVN